MAQESDLASLQRINAAQLRIKAQISDLQRKYNLLERRKKELLRKIARAADKMEMVHNQLIPSEIARKIEDEVNAAGMMEDIIVARFKNEAEHGRGSTKWAKLAKSTVKQREREGFGGRHPILYRYGTLMSGAIDAVRGTFKFRDEPIKWNIEDVPVEYAKYHQDGTDRMPARPFLDPPTREEMKKVNKRVDMILRKELRKVMRKQEASV